MSLQFKSNVLANENVYLPDVKTISFTSQQILDEYTSRVQADGGTIVSPQLALQAIDNAKASGLLGKISLMASAAWGVKLNSENRVEKVYSIIGEDLEGFAIGSGGELPLHRLDSNGFNSIAVDSNASKVGGLLRTVLDVSISKSVSTDFSVISSMNVNENGRAAMQVVYGNEAGAGGFAPLIIGRSSSEANSSTQDDTYNPNASSDASKRILLSSNLGGGSYSSTGLNINSSTGDAKLIVNGSVTDNELSPTGGIFDYTSIQRRVYIGAGLDGSNNFSSNRGGDFRDLYILSNTTVDETKGVTRYLTNIYS